LDVSIMAVPSITHDQFVALCDEMAALARAGVPLEKGLVALAEDLPGRLGTFTREMGQRLEQGANFERVLDEANGSVPPAFRAVIVAGLRSGRLAVALEGVAGTLRRAGELRRLTWLSLVYPLFVLALAYVLFVFTAGNWATSIWPAYERFQLGPNAPLDFVARLGRTAGTWAVWPPLVLGLVVAGCWLRSRRVRWSSRGGRLGRWPTPGKLLQLGRLATFADVLSLLVRERVPLAQAVPLAGDASGDARLAAGARELSQRLMRGESPDKLVAAAGAIPPLLAWRIAAGSQRGDLASLLQRAAAGYRRKAQRTYDTLTLSLPLLLTATIGGSAVLLYALSVVVPWAITLLHLQGEV
jgi:general secretion pathway protein F